MSADRTPAGFIWRTFWRKARTALRDRARYAATPRIGELPRPLQEVYDLGGVGPLAVLALLARERGEGAWPRLDLARWRSWRAYRAAGGRLGWVEFRRDPFVRAVAMQAMAVARRAGAPPAGPALVEAGTEVMRRWGWPS